MTKITTILLLVLISCKTKQNDQPIINIKYFGNYYYDNDSSVKFKDSVLFRNDNKGQNWCYFYYPNNLFKVNEIPTTDSVIITHNNYKFKGKK